jgi:hypothetical protein
MRCKTTSRFVHHTEKRSNSSRSASFTVARWPRRLQSGGSNRASNSGHAGRTCQMHWIMKNVSIPGPAVRTRAAAVPTRASHTYTIVYQP